MELFMGILPLRQGALRGSTEKDILQLKYARNSQFDRNLFFYFIYF